MKYFWNWQCPVERCAYFFAASLGAQSECQKKSEISKSSNRNDHVDNHSEHSRTIINAARFAMESSKFYSIWSKS